MMQRPASSAHKEIVLEDHLVDQLVTLQGYEQRPSDKFDRTLAMDKELVLRFIQQTQPEEWKKVEAQYSTSAAAELFKQLEKALKTRGPLDVLRAGVKMIPNISLRLCFFKPASSLNPQLVELFDANILSVMRQVRYSRRSENAIDVVLFLNGLPVMTLELKNLLTGTTFRHAEQQYRKDRSPAGEPLLTFKRGALVHFALDEDNISMTTQLKNGKTFFLPFNRGRDGGSGNPDVPGEFRVAYLYADLPECPAVFGRETLLMVLQRFMHLERKTNKGGTKKEIMIFPRFQQLDAVAKLMGHAKTHGAGHNYLIQHSAGSGKSNTIAWTAHQAISLHDAQDNSIFDTAIIVTDRLVLDRQLQDTVSQFQQVAGVVKKIDGTSKDLKKAIESGARIIITTIQKFGTDHLKEVSGQATRNFAILIDEAHGSQSGKTAQAMKEVLTREPSCTSEDIEDLIAAHQKNRGPQSNISSFAFTATPRNVTLESFGTIGPDGKPQPFHLYTMRQAIEEGFILDVLQNYMTYKAYYELEKVIEDDPTFKTKKAQRKVAKYAHMHPTAISQKVEVMVDHFRRHVAAELGGNAKAMVVTASRESALRTYFGMRDYIKRQGYEEVQALVAFSGELEVDGETWTETELNGFPEGELPSQFDGESYQLLIVAEKYQTGFDQPKLCAMYVDRKLAGLQAVQTLSRLNRMMPGKGKTFVLDFQNSMDDIREAFKPFYEATLLEERSDPNQIYELEARLKTFGILDVNEIERFAATYFQHHVSSQDRAMLEGLVRQAVERFKLLDEDEGRQEEFRQLLKSYMRFYSFISQVVTLRDSALEKLYAYVSWLSRLLPNREVPPDIEITEEMMQLRAFRIDEKEKGNASLSAGQSVPLSEIKEFGAKPYTPEEEKSLSDIIHSFNERHGTEFTEEDFLRFEQVSQEIMNDDMREMLKNNPEDVVFQAFSQAFFKAAIRMFQRDAEMKSIVLSDPQARDQAIKHFFGRAMREVR